MLNKNLYKKELMELIKDDETLSKGNSIYEAIYMIDDLVVYGGFKDGFREHYHIVLKSDDIGWDEILSYGTLIVPENRTYVSDEINEELAKAGFARLPLDRNHIVGF